ncbi:hypothetical protein [Amycolatopsis sp.]|uniref:hypothetical protein n=1 Tax=Amycolatopsis sp. TaxID=37632 RepID=UPI002CC1F1EF|nr:hypothetical protein [Amycolatopsis sp.]HVV09354.1 hypothetical protein [Amycolatopsis sp.]
MDELREALLAREPLAPDPDEMLAAAGRRVERHRARRRVAGAVAAVAVVVAGVTTGMSLLRSPAPEAPGLTVAAPGAVSAPELPFTLSGELTGYQVTNWTQSGTGFSAELTGISVLGSVEIWLGTEDPEIGQTSPVTAVEVNGGPATVRTVGSHGQLRISWQPAPGRWATILAGVSGATAEALELAAEGLSIKPVPAEALLQSLTVPGSLSVASWTGYSGALDTVVLCPVDVPSKNPPTFPGGLSNTSCVTVQAGKGDAPYAPLPAGNTSFKEVERTRNGDVYLSDDHRMALRRVGADGWVLAQTEHGDASVLPELVISAKVG